MKEKMSVVVAVAVVCLVSLQAGCGGGGGAAVPTAAATPVPSPTPAPLGAVDPALVGSWAGSLSGSYGPADMTLLLNADGTAEFEGSHPPYCRVRGDWGVSGTQFAVRGIDCTASRLTLAAPVSSTTLTGTWSANNGAAAGEFSVTKQ
jgi:hypothetical protein